MDKGKIDALRKKEYENEDLIPIGVSIPTEIKKIKKSEKLVVYDRMIDEIFSML